MLLSSPGALALLLAGYVVTLAGYLVDVHGARWGFAVSLAAALLAAVVVARPRRRSAMLST